jgi:hypothetical protein
MLLRYFLLTFYPELFLHPKRRSIALINDALLNVKIASSIMYYFFYMNIISLSEHN